MKDEDDIAAAPVRGAASPWESLAFYASPSALPCGLAGGTAQSESLTIHVRNDGAMPVRCPPVIFVLGSGGADDALLQEGSGEGLAVESAPGCGWRLGPLDPVEHAFSADGEPDDPIPPGGTRAIEVSGIAVDRRPGTAVIHVLDGGNRARVGFLFVTRCETYRRPPATRAGDERALFTYAIHPQFAEVTEDINRPSIASFRISIYNGTDRDIDCDAIVFELPVGFGAGDLLEERYCADVEATVLGPKPGWRVKREGPALKLHPLGNVSGIDARGALMVQVDRVRINDVPGSARLEIWEWSEPCDGDSRRSFLDVMKGPSQGIHIEFSANKYSVWPDEEVVLTWLVTGTDGVWLEWNDRRQRHANRDTLTVSPRVTTKYLLVAGKRSQSLDILVVRPEILRFEADHREVAQGHPVRLSYEIANGVSATLNGDKLENLSRGDKIVTPDTTTRYYLDVYGRGGKSVSESLLVTVRDVEITAFDCDPRSIKLGEDATLRWDAEWAIGLSMDPPVGDVSGGSARVSPSRSTTYRLTAQGHGGPKVKSVHLRVEPVEITELWISPPSVKPDQWATIGWATRYAEAVELDGERVEREGSQEIRADRPTAYRLTAYGPDGPVFKAVTLNVESVQILAAGCYESDPNVAIIVWRTKNCDFVSIEGSFGLRWLKLPADGHVTFDPRPWSEYNFVIKAFGAGHSPVTRQFSFNDT